MTRYAIVFLAAFVLIGAGTTVEAEESFRDCAECPEMVVIPAGRFIMGGSEANIARMRMLSENLESPPEWVLDMSPRHEVIFATPFAIARTEVTFAEWDNCVAGGGCAHSPDDQGWGRDDRPVIDISWADAHAYVAWLSQVSGRPYRLPSEAEWEYAARAGSQTERWWGDEIGIGNANCYDCEGSVESTATTPVGSFAANPFGLHDVLGNVQELVEDCWRSRYDGAPADGSVWFDPGECQWRVGRGGAWQTFRGDVRSSHRLRVTEDERGDYIGLRVALTLE